MSTNEEFLTAAETAVLLRMSERSVRRLLGDGTIPGMYLGTREGWRVRKSDLMTWRTNSPRRVRGDGHPPGPL